MRRLHRVKRAKAEAEVSRAVNLIVHEGKVASLPNGVKILLRLIPGRLGNSFLTGFLLGCGEHAAEIKIVFGENCSHLLFLPQEAVYLPLCLNTSAIIHPYHITGIGLLQGNTILVQQLGNGK